MKRSVPGYPALAARTLSFAILALVAMFNLATPALGQDESRRFLVVNAHSMPAGATFKSTEYLLGHEEKFIPKFKRFLNNGSIGHDRYKTFINSLNADKLAMSIVTALESRQSIEVQIFVLSSLFEQKGKKFIREFLERSMVVTHNFFGPPVQRPLFVARVVSTGKLFHSMKARRADSSGREQSLDILLNASSGCPVSTGTAIWTRRGFNIEVSRDGKLLLFGALGDTTAYFVATEERYLTFGKETNGRQAISVPDAPSQLYEGAIRPDGLDLRAKKGGDCKLEIVGAIG